MARIRVDYSASLAQAKRLEQAAEQCGDTISSLKAQMASSEGYWKGTSGEAMRGKLQETIAELTRTQAQMRTAAGNIRSVVKELQEKDRKLAAIVSKSFI